MTRVAAVERVLRYEVPKTHYEEWLTVLFGLRDGDERRTVAELRQETAELGGESDVEVFKRTKEKAAVGALADQIVADCLATTDEQGYSRESEIALAETTVDPVVDIINPDGQTIDMDVIDVDPGSVDISGPFTIEALEEHYVLNATGYPERTLFTRTLRVKKDGFRVFRYAFEEDPRAILRRLQFGVRGTARVERVLRMARNNYVFEITLPGATQAGDVVSLQFFLATDGETSEETGMVVKQHAVETRQLLLSVEFRAGQPARVWWFEVGFPMLSLPSGAPYAGDDHLLPKLPTGMYEKDFASIGVGQMVGIAWEL